MALLKTLTSMYSVYGLDGTAAQPEVTADENDDLPRVICSEALLG